MHGGFDLQTGAKLFDLTAHLRAMELEMTERARADQDKTKPLEPASFPLGRAWFLVCCFAGREDAVNTEIRKLGFETFLPRERKRQIVRGRRVVTLRSLFPGYLFASFDRTRDDWGAICAIDGVLDVYKRDSIPVRVPDVQIERFRNAESAGLFDYTHASANFTDGQLVEIEDGGPFHGMLARIKSASAKKRVKILLESLATITIDPAFLRKV